MHSIGICYDRPTRSPIETGRNVLKIAGAIQAPSQAIFAAIRRALSLHTYQTNVKR
jgi:hypothetical protein